MSKNVSVTISPIDSSNSLVYGETLIITSDESKPFLEIVIIATLLFGPR